MNIVNLNSDCDLGPAQVHYTQTVILGECHHGLGEDSLARLMGEIPIYLLRAKSMPDQAKWKSEKPPIEWLASQLDGSKKQSTEHAAKPTHARWTMGFVR